MHICRWYNIYHLSSTINQSRCKFSQLLLSAFSSFVVSALFLFLLLAVLSVVSGYNIKNSVKPLISTWLTVFQMWTSAAGTRVRTGASVWTCSTTSTATVSTTGRGRPANHVGFKTALCRVWISPNSLRSQCRPQAHLLSVTHVYVKTLSLTQVWVTNG